MNRPVIVFIHQGHQGEIEKDLDAYCKKHNMTSMCYKIAEKQHILGMIAQGSHEKLGIFIVNPELYRGFNLKLQEDAFVIAVDSAGALKYTEARQMVGRSSRKRGHAIGKVLVKRTNQDLGTDGKQILKGREVFQSDNGGTILQAIVRYSRDVEGDEKLEAMVRAIGENMHPWRFTEAQFADIDEDVMTIINAASEE